MPVKTPLKQAFENIHEQGIKPVVQDAANQFKPMGSDLVKMLYWSYTTPPESAEQIHQKNTTHKSNDAKALQMARSRHAEILGQPKNEGKKTEEVKSNSNTNSNLLEDITGIKMGKNHESTNKSLIIEHHREAQELGQTRENEEARKKQQEEKEQEEEKLAKKKAEKDALENPIEAPTGRQTGVSFGRKKAKSKMTKPPVSTETRGSNNRE